jgi:hypothetical protein
MIGKMQNAQTRTSENGDYLTSNKQKEYEKRKDCYSNCTSFLIYSTSNKQKEYEKRKDSYSNCTGFLIYSYFRQQYLICLALSKI